MICYVNRVVTDSDVKSDIKLLIPDAGLRRRMSKIVKNAVSAAVECVSGVNSIDALDAIITATGWGCLADSERFLRNFIENKEQLLNPTPFIQSTFNTVGGQIALLRHNHCYNMTYVNRSHSFEDALLDAMMRIADCESKNILLGSFDEQTPSQHKIMERMGAFRKCRDGEGCVFVNITANKEENTIAQIVQIDFPRGSLTEEECLKYYAAHKDVKLLYNTYSQYGLFPTSSAYCFAEAVKLVQTGTAEVVIYNEYFGASPAVLKIQCVG